MFTSLPYYPGSVPREIRPLARFLPPLPDGVASHWLSNNIPKGSWIIDPFGASPRLVIEAAQAGYRVLVAVNNPIARFLIEIAASQPSQVDLRSAVSELASAYHGNERIEPFIRSLYQTNCAACGQPVIANAFLWERGAEIPYAKVYHCPHCGDEGEHPTNEGDNRLAAQFSGSSVHRARALERVTPLNDPDRVHVEEALSHYLPRAVFILFSLLNRLDGLTISSTHRHYLQALLLHAFDMGNTLWAVPIARPRPRQLATPSRFRENNIWLALEQGIEAYGKQDSTSEVPTVSWPAELHQDGGICIFEGRLKDLTSSMLSKDIEAVITAIPRYNQAFWTLSALWAGWLWGREAVGPFKIVLRRKAYDWAWHTAALYMSMQHLVPLLKEDTPFFGLLSEVESGFITATLTAADAAGFELSGIALQEDHQQAQIFWKQKIPKSEISTNLSMEQVATQTIQAYLSERGEPGSYISSLTAGLSGFAEHRLFWKEMNPNINLVEKEESGSDDTVGGNKEPQTPPRPHRLYSTTTATIRMALTNKGEFTDFHVTERVGTEDTPEKTHIPNPEQGLYWLYASESTNLSLSDQVEMATVRYLLKNHDCTFKELQETIFNSFPGLLTPSDELLKECLESYAEPTSENETRWQIKTQDQPFQRHQDLNEIREALENIGERLGLRVRIEKVGFHQDRDAIGWFDASEKPLFWFIPIASAILSDIIFHEKLEMGEKRIVLPGSRSNLVIYKLRHNPLIEEHCRQPDGWKFLKFRYLRWQLENPLLTRESVAETLELDPLTYSTPQMRLL